MDAYLASSDTKKALWLGKTVGPRPTATDRIVNSFHIGPKGGPRNYEDLDLNKAVWKFLAEHTGLNIQIALGAIELHEAIGDFGQELDVHEYISGDQGHP